MNDRIVFVNKQFVRIWHIQSIFKSTFIIKVLGLYILQLALQERFGASINVRGKRVI